MDIHYNKKKCKSPFSSNQLYHQITLIQKNGLNKLQILRRKRQQIINNGCSPEHQGAFWLAARKSQFRALIGCAHSLLDADWLPRNDNFPSNCPNSRQVFVSVVPRSNRRRACIVQHVSAAIVSGRDSSWGHCRRSD